MPNASGIFLGVDTALGETGLALWRDGAVAARFHEAAREDQAALLVPRLEALLAAANVASYRDLEAIAVCVGPGGFTSIRVGLAAMRGVAFAAGIAIGGYSSLRMMAFGSRQRDITAILPAGREHYFVQCFGAEGDAQPRMVAASELPPLTAVVTTREEISAPCYCRHDTSQNAALLVEMRACGEVPLPAVPLYVRPPDATPQASFLEQLKLRQVP